MEAVLAAAGAFDTVRAVRGSAALMLLADLSAARYRSRVLWFCRGSGGLRGNYRMAGSWSDLLLYQDSTHRRCDGCFSGCRISWNGLRNIRSEEHTSELQSLMRISYAVFCLKKKN